MSCGALFSSFFPFAITRVPSFRWMDEGSQPISFFGVPRWRSPWTESSAKFALACPSAWFFSFFLASIGSRLAGWLLHNPQPARRAVVGRPASPAKPVPHGNFTSKCFSVCSLLARLPLTTYISSGDAENRIFTLLVPAVPRMGRPTTGARAPHRGWAASVNPSATAPCFRPW